MALVTFEPSVIYRIPPLGHVQHWEKYFFINKGVMVTKKRVQATITKNLTLALCVAQMDDLMLGITTPMFLLDPAGTLVFCNDAAELVIGKPFAEIGEITALEFGKVLQLHEADGSPLRRRDTPAGIAFYQQKPAHRTVLVTGYDGVQKLLEVTAYPLFGTAGEMHGVVTVFWPAGDGDPGDREDAA